MSMPDPDAHWPSCDDEQPGVSIRPLSHADLAALLAHLEHHDDGQNWDGATIPWSVRWAICSLLGEFGPAMTPLRSGQNPAETE